MSAQETFQDLFVRLFFSVFMPTGIVVLALYIFNSMSDIKYLPASAMAFGVGFFFIYLIFKYWIRPDIQQGSSWQQFKRFIVIFGINVAINTEIVYLLVNYFEVPLLTAQIVATVVVTYESYYAYLSLLMRNDHMQLVRARPKKTATDIEYYDEDGRRLNV